MTPEQRVLFESHLPLAYSIVGKFLASRQRLYRFKDELTQEARMALWRAALYYRPGASKFSSYAYPSVRTALREAAFHLKKDEVLVLEDPPDIVFGLDAAVGQLEARQCLKFILSRRLTDRFANTLLGELAQEPLPFHRNTIRRHHRTGRDQCSPFVEGLAS